MLIYERLLACAILTGSQALALSLLAKLKGKLKRVQAWKIPLNSPPKKSKSVKIPDAVRLAQEEKAKAQGISVNMSEGAEIDETVKTSQDERAKEEKILSNMREHVEIAEALKVSKDDAENVKADKISDLNARDKRLKYFITSESKIFALVPTASDLEGKVVITHETEDVVMIVEEDNESVLRKLAGNNMTDVLVQINELGIYVGDFEGLVSKDLSKADKKWFTFGSRLKDFGLLCKLSSINYPLSKIAQAKLKSPEEWVCKDVSDYLQLLVKYPEAHDDPLAWLLKSGVKTGVLKKILGLLDSEEKAKHFFNDFVCSYTKDPIKFMEEILLGNLIEKHLGMIFPIYLQLINGNPTNQNKFAQVYKKCILKDGDEAIAQDMILHLLQFPEQCPELDQLAIETLSKCGEDFFSDCLYDHFIKQLLRAYLSGRKTATQTKRWVKLFFAKSTTFLGADCSEQELVEVLIYNLFKSLTDTQHEPETVKKFFNKAYNKKGKNLLSSVSSLFDTVLACMAYEVTIPAEGCFTIVKSNSKALLTQYRLAGFYKELLTLAQINKIALPNASSCKGYNEFVKNTAISLPSAIDAISFFIVNMQVIMHLQLIEELHQGWLQFQIQAGDHSTVLQFANGVSEPLRPIEYSVKDGKKIIKISYYINTSVTLPSLALFKTNTDNFCQIKSILSSETTVQLHDPFWASIICLRDSLFTCINPKAVRSSLQQAFPYHQQSSQATLTEQLIYYSLYCLCMKAKSSEHETSSALLQVFERVNETSLLDLALSALGIELQFASAETITIKQNGKHLCSENDMLSLKNALTKLVLIIPEWRDNVAASKCREHEQMKEKLGISLPEDLSALEYCLFSITLAHRISSIFTLQASLASKQQIPQYQNGLKVSLVAADDKKRLDSLLSSSETTIILLHKIKNRHEIEDSEEIEEIKRIRPGYILNLVAFPATSMK